MNEPLAVREAPASYVLEAQRVRPGYKQTEVGGIPEDWEILTGEQITTLIGKGSSPRWQGFVYSNSGMLFVTSENVRDGFLDVREPKYLPIAFHEKLKRTKLQYHDILINLVGASIGRSCQIQCELGEANINQAVAVFRVREQYCSAFIACYFQSPLTVDRILGMQVDAARPNISLSDLRRFLIPLPTKAEQEAIAEALNDADALIESLEQLIAKKRHLKQGAMQELLSGKKRLPGFSGEWEVKRLGELGHFLKGSGVRKDKSLSGNLPCIRYGEIYTKHRDYIKAFYSWISPEVAATARLLKQGDLLFAGSGETKEEIGKCVAFVEDIVAYAGGDIVILRPEKSSPAFLGFYLNTASINTQKASRGQGDAVVHISFTALSSIEIAIPKYEEQTAIATILTDMDADIAALEQQLAKARGIKQGMMQELLTGRIRLV